MTDEELFKVYIKRELCVHCRFPQFCKGEDVCSHIATAKRHYLAGVDAGKSQAETDLATIAYMQGAEQYKTKWHYPSKGEYPKEGEDVLCYCKCRTEIKFCCVGHVVVGGDNKIRWWSSDRSEKLNVIAWKEITPPKEVKE